MIPEEERSHHGDVATCITVPDVHAFDLASTKPDIESEVGR
jgi:hypothetical protein